MDERQQASQIEQLMKLNEEFRERQTSMEEMLTQLQQEVKKRVHDHESLLVSTQTLIEDRNKLQERVEELEAINQRLVDMLWGRRSERRVDDPDQQSLDFGEAPSDEQPDVLMAQLQADEALDKQIVLKGAERRRQRKEKQRKTREFPKHLERRERVLDLTDEEKAGLKQIGEAITERMRFEKPNVYIERIVRPKYVAQGQAERGVIAHAPPLSIMEGCKYDFSVIAAILTQKFAFHCPTYRQQDWFAQSGWHPSRSTINDLINVSVDVLKPLFNQMWHLLLQEPILLTDDTRVTLLTRDSLSREQQESLQGRRKSAAPPGNRSKKKEDDRGSVNSYAWVYTGLKDSAPYNVFQWSLTHQHAVVDEHLALFKGTIVGDAFGGYTQIQKRSEGRILHASCNTHARREFVKGEASEPILCAQAESIYRQLYDVEERGKTLDTQGLLDLRQRDAVPLWDSFGKWIESEKVQRILPQSETGKAIGYLRNQWTALQRYLSDGRIPFDNNQSEQEIRPLTVGRKNWIFLGHPQAAPGRLQLISIASSAARNHLVVHDYLEDVLRKLAAAAQHNPAQLELGSEYLLDLLPDRWAATHPKSVRHERIEEKKRVSEDKRVRRAYRRLQARRKARAQC